MPFVAAPGVTQVSVLWSLDTERGENNFYYTGITHPISGHQAYVDGISNTIKTAFQAFIHTDVAFAGVYIRDLSTQTGESFELPPTSIWHGTDASQRLPNNCTIAVKRSTGNAGRSQRGRIYHPVLTADLTGSANAISSGFATALIAGWTAFKTFMFSTNGATEVILHRKTGTHSTVLEYSLADLNIDSQRRRLPGHNRHR